MRQCKQNTLDVSPGILLAALVMPALAIPIISGLVGLKEARAQSQAPVVFDLISIRPSIPDRSSGPGARGGGGGTGRALCAGSPPGVTPRRILFNNNSLSTLITLAYGLDCRDDLVSGGPEWARSSRWVIQALIPESAGLQLPASIRFAESPFLDPQLQTMLQNLLADRFKLAFHRESRSIQILKLTVAKGGPKLERPDDVPCSPNFAKSPDDPLIRSPKPNCTIVLRGSIANFLPLLESLLGRPIVDETGITGMFEFRLIFAIDPSAGTTGAPGTSPPDPSGPSIFTALQEQLGLKLEATRGPAEAFVIDYVEMPEPN